MTLLDSAPPAPAAARPPIAGPTANAERVESERVDGKGGGMFVRESFGLGLGLLHVGEMLVFTSSTTPSQFSSWPAEARP